MDSMIDFFQFLDLPENAADSDVEKRIESKKRTFDELLKNAPNEYLKKIHQNNSKKIIEIRAYWDKVKTPDKKTPKYIDHEPITSNHQPKMLMADEPEFEAWLIRHTEEKNSKTLKLMPKGNHIGRLFLEGHHNHILDDDAYISRHHAIIEWVKDQVYIADVDQIGLKASKNGVYLNGNTNRITTKKKLLDGDTIQIGTTKFILKVRRNEQLSDLVKKVENSEYMRTVVIDIL